MRLSSYLRESLQMVPHTFRNIFSALERQRNTAKKLRLDLKYFETCLDLNLCPEFSEFTPIKLQIHRNGKKFYQIFRKKLKDKGKESGKFRFNSQMK